MITRDNLGPGEAFATVGSEGPYVYVVLKDGSTAHRIVEQLAVDVSIPTVERRT